MDDGPLQQELEFFTNLFSEGNPREILEQFHDKTFQSFIESQFRIEETAKQNRKESFKKLHGETESDEELKLQLKNAVREYKKNKKENNPPRSEPFSNAHLSKKRSIECDSMNKGTNTTTQAKANRKQYEVPKEIENLKKKESETNTTSEIESNRSAYSDVQQLINFFFLKEIDQSENTEIKKYKHYEKQGAIPRYLFRKSSFENYVNDFNNERLKSKTKVERRNAGKGVSSDLGDVKNESNDRNFSRHHSNDNIVKLGERTCSKPFFYIVPENPSPNFLFSPGSYFVIPRHPSSSANNITIHHPETKPGCKKNANIDFQVKASQQSISDTGVSIPDMNDLGREVAQNPDSHLNIGPRDVKFNDSWRNLEANCERNKNYDKSMGCPDIPPKDIAVSQEQNQKIETLNDRTGELESESVSGAMAITSVVSGPLITHLESTEVDSTQPSDFVTQQESQQPEEWWSDNVIRDLLSAQVTGSYTDEGVFQEIQAADLLEQKIEEQFSRLLSALPEHNVQELKEVCNAFQGDEEQVTLYIEEALRKNRQYQHILELQSIFPDADPVYLREELEHLGGDDNAINVLTSRLLDSRDYPKIMDDYLDSGRQRLWRMYVQNFKIADYIRNVPDLENFEVTDNSDKYTDLALEFLQSRYPQVSVYELEQVFTSSNKNIIKACTSPALRTHEPLRLANSSFKNKNFDETFLKQACYIDHKKEIDKYLNDLKERKEIEVEEARLNDTFLYCPLCCSDELVISEAVTCPEGDIFCMDCIKRYVFVKMGDGVYKFPCPSEDCESFLTYPTLEKLLPDRVLSNIMKKQQAVEINVAEVDGLETCPFCEYAYIPNPEDKIFKCQNVECLVETCRKCREKNHIPLHCEEVERSVDLEARKKIEETMTEKLVRICPTCFKKFVKIDGCNKMVCTCGTIVCYYCRRKVCGYDHFRGPNNVSGLCPLYSENSDLHVNQVLQAGIEARNQILQENPHVRIVHDPTTSGGL